MLDGAIQILNTGVIPGNRNAGNIDKSLEKLSAIFDLSKTFKTDSVKAVSIASLEFGRKVAQAIAIHPDYSYATIDEKRYQKYVIKVTAREKNAHKFFHKGMIYKKFSWTRSMVPMPIH